MKMQEIPPSSQILTEQIRMKMVSPSLMGFETQSTVKFFINFVMHKIFAYFQNIFLVHALSFLKPKFCMFPIINSQTSASRVPKHHCCLGCFLLYAGKSASHFKNMYMYYTFEQIKNCGYPNFEQS